MTTEFKYEHADLYATCPCCGLTPHYAHTSVQGIAKTIAQADGKECFINFVTYDLALVKAIRQAFPDYQIALARTTTKGYFLMRPW